MGRYLQKYTVDISIIANLAEVRVFLWDGIVALIVTVRGRPEISFLSLSTMFSSRIILHRTIELFAFPTFNKNKTKQIQAQPGKVTIS